MLVAKTLIGLKAESTRGTFANPSTGDATGSPQIFPAYNIRFNPQGELRAAPEMSQRPGARPGQPDVAPMTISFDVRLKGRTGAGTAPTERLALMACGLAEEVNAATSVVYRPALTYDGSSGGAGLGTRPAASYSAVVWEDGMAYKLVGGRGKGSITAKAGDWVVLSCEIQGYYYAAVAEALPTPAAVSTFQPPVVQSCGLTAFGVAAGNFAFETLTLDFGAEIAEVPDANSANFGRLGYDLVNVRPSGSFDPKMILPATHDFYGIWQAGTQGQITTSTIGSSAGNRITINAANVQYDPPQGGERAGHRVNQQRFKCVAADTAAEGYEFSITIS